MCVCVWVGGWARVLCVLCVVVLLLQENTKNVKTNVTTYPTHVHHPCVGLARTVYTHRI